MTYRGDVVLKLQLSWRLIVSLILGGMTYGTLVLGEAKLQYSSVLHGVTEIGLTPALLIAAIFYPEGGHTGGGVPYFGYVLIGSGIVFYTVLWFVIVSWLNRRGLSSGA
jgi:hypothetical protein